MLFDQVIQGVCSEKVYILEGYILYFACSD